MLYTCANAELARRQRESLLAELDKASYSRTLEMHHADIEERRTAPSLWDGVVNNHVGPRVRLLMQGPLMMRNPQEGDLVEVLGEEAGPGGAYLLCHSPDGRRTGYLHSTWVARRFDEQSSGAA